MNKMHCNGCRQNVYNQGLHGIKECWNLETAKLKVRYRIHMDAPMDVKANFRKVKLPNCYTTSGYSSPSCTTIVDSIPKYAK